MKKLTIVFSLILVTAFALSACAPKPEVKDVEAMLVEKLAGEHTLEFVLKEKRTAAEWSEVIDRMIDYGADINEEEKSLIIEWLLAKQQSQ